MYNIGRYNTKHQKHTVFVGNVNSKMSEREIEDIFARYGRLENVDFARRKRFGEVYFNYSNRDHAFKALEMNNVKIMGRRLRVSFNSEKPIHREGYTIYYTMRQRKYLNRNLSPALPRPALLLLVSREDGYLAETNM